VPRGGQKRYEKETELGDEIIVELRVRRENEWRNAMM